MFGGGLGPICGGAWLTVGEEAGEPCWKAEGDEAGDLPARCGGGRGAATLEGAPCGLFPGGAAKGPLGCGKPACACAACWLPKGYGGGGCGGVCAAKEGLACSGGGAVPGRGAFFQPWFEAMVPRGAWARGGCRAPEGSWFQPGGTGPWAAAGNGGRTAGGGCCCCCCCCGGLACCCCCCGCWCCCGCCCCCCCSWGQLAGFACLLAGRGGTG